MCHTVDFGVLFLCLNLLCTYQKSTSASFFVPAQTLIKPKLLTRFAINFFPMSCSMQENKEITTNEPCTRTTFQPILNQEFFFGSQLAVFTRDQSHLKYWLLHPFFYKEATCKSSTIKGLLYALKAVPSKDYFTHLTLTNTKKGCRVISPNFRASHPWHICAVGDVVPQRYDVLRD